VLITFLAVSFAWIFFRAENLEQAIQVINGLFGGLDGQRHLDTQPYIFLLLLIFGVLELARGNKRFDQFCASYSGIQRWTLYCFLIFCILTVCGSEYSAFIYFKF
jgi:hypothetical protein